MKLFAENPNSVLDSFSQDFEKGFLETLNHCHGTKRVLVNRVYQEYIADKHHIHMNGTVWTTLTGFCKYLGKEGKAIVDETEKGWYIQYIDRDPKAIAKQMQAEQRKLSDSNEEEQNKKFIESQIQLAFDRYEIQDDENPVLTDIVDGQNNGMLKKSMTILPSQQKKRKLGCSAFTETSNENIEQISSEGHHNIVLEKLIQEEERRKVSRKDTPNAAPICPHPVVNWAQPGIFVKVVSEKDEFRKFHRKRASIIAVQNETVEVNVENEKVLMHYSDVQTVVGKVSSVSCLY